MNFEKTMAALCQTNETAFTNTARERAMTKKMKQEVDKARRAEAKAHERDVEKLYEGMSLIDEALCRRFNIDRAKFTDDEWHEFYSMDEDVKKAIVWSCEHLQYSRNEHGVLIDSLNRRVVY